MRLFYSVYGLHLCSNVPIPGLVASKVGIEDVQVCMGMMPPWLHEAGGEQQKWFTSPFINECGEPTLKVRMIGAGAYFRLLYSDGTEFLVDRSGTQVWARWPDMLTLEDTATYLLGPVLGFLLRLRGITCLHASSIAISNRAVALLGPAGAGKSTTAAVFAGQGYPILSDDVVALGDQGSSFMVQPAYPRLRLWPSSVNILYRAADALPRLTPTWDKRFLDLTQNGHLFQQEPLPLGAIYILGDRCADPAAPLVEDVSARAGLMSLVANTYTNYLLDKAMRAREFEVLTRVMTSIPVRMVRPHQDPAHLPKLCDVIVDDYNAITSSALATVGAEQY